MHPRSLSCTDRPALDRFHDASPLFNKVGADDARVVSTFQHAAKPTVTSDLDIGVQESGVWVGTFLQPLVQPPGMATRSLLNLNLKSAGVSVTLKHLPGAVSRSGVTDG
jgi:hypothetical protein